MRRFLLPVLVLILLGLALGGCQPMAGSWVYMIPSQTTYTITASEPSVEVITDLTLPVPATATINVTPDTSTLQARIIIADTTGTTPVVLDTAAAAAPGERVILQTFPLEKDHLYAVSVEGENGTEGGFSVELYYDTAVEEEEEGEITDSVQSIQDSFLPSLNGTSRGAVFGLLNGGADSDLYQITLAAGEKVQLAFQVNDNAYPILVKDHIPDKMQPLDMGSGAGVALTASTGPLPLSFVMMLLDSEGAPITGTTITTRALDGVQEYVVPKSGAYFVMVRQEDRDSDIGFPYQILVVRDGTLEVEQNDSPSTAQPLALGRPVFGYVGENSAFTFDVRTPPGLVISYPFEISINEAGEFVNSLDTGFLYRDTAQLSVAAPHQLRLVKGAQSIALQGIHYGFSTVGNRHSLVITGIFPMPDDPAQQVSFRREVSWYESQSAAYVHTQLTNETGAALEGYSLMDQFNPAPGGDELTANDRVLDADLLVSTAAAGTVGAGSPDPSVSLSFTGSADPEGASFDDSMQVVDALPALEADAITTGAFYLVFGYSADNVLLRYQDAVAQGSSLDDYFSVTLTGQTNYTLTAFLPSTLADQFNPPSLEVYDARGVRLTGQNGIEVDNGAELHFRPPADGSYTIRVFLEPELEFSGLDYVFNIKEKTYAIYLPYTYTHR